MPWGEIKKGASDYLKASAAKAEQARLHEQAQKIAADLADPKLPELARKKAEAALAMVNVQMEEAAVQVPAGKKTESKPKTLIQLIQGLVEGRPIQDVEAAFTWLGSYIIDKTKSDRLVNTGKQAVAKAKAEADKTGAPAPTVNGDKPASNDDQERAAASNAATKAKARRARKSSK
jgi:hypothetical protein